MSENQTLFPKLEVGSTSIGTTFTEANVARFVKVTIAETFELIPPVGLHPIHTLIPVQNDLSSRLFPMKPGDHLTAWQKGAE